MNRRQFLYAVGATSIFLACGKGNDTDILPDEEEEVLFRFAIASDLHYGEMNTDYAMHTRNFVSAFRSFHKTNPCAFLVLNGDIIHDDPRFLPEAYDALKDVHEKLYVTQGNHDRVSDSVWLDTWKQAVNSDFTIDDMAFIFGTTSDVFGSLKCPDLDFLRTSLEKYKNKKHVFIFWHIHPHSPSMGCTENVKEVLKDYTNVRAVFNGHDHNEEGIRNIEKIPYMFDGRLGGSWGSFDRNFRIIEITKSEIITYLMTPLTRKMLNKFNV
ncbi:MULTISPECIES: metallophosphoesterase family protein [Sphingobacterium]|uniref:Metallophosphoesterase n=1 Tax=Sphingobacterium chuzhouense TaxID=1742264 RepID=A0ABR7XVH6_9SPHI|nr:MULTISPECIES: metallophosphoesterase [Sphingobacterium]MBD1423057.1 metallophosphoesterase [Sphingobacterium chuzhouense]NGM66702.1 metallophosphoesterase [Sphingobacterium sp. SGR-19]